MDWTARPAIVPPRPTDAMLEAAETVLGDGSRLERQQIQALWGAMVKAASGPEGPRAQDMAWLIQRMMRALPSDSKEAVQAKEYLDRHHQMLLGSPLRDASPPAPTDD